MQDYYLEAESTEDRLGWVRTLRDAGKTASSSCVRSMQWRADISQDDKSPGVNRVETNPAVVTSF